MATRTPEQHRGDTEKEDIDAFLKEQSDLDDSPHGPVDDDFGPGHDLGDEDLAENEEGMRMVEKSESGDDPPAEEESTAILNDGDPETHTHVSIRTNETRTHGIADDLRSEYDALIAGLVQKMILKFETGTEGVIKAVVETGTSTIDLAEEHFSSTGDQLQQMCGYLVSLDAKITNVQDQIDRSTKLSFTTAKNVKANAEAIFELNKLFRASSVPLGTEAARATRNPVFTSESPSERNETAASKGAAARDTLRIMRQKNEAKQSKK